MHTEWEEPTVERYRQAFAAIRPSITAAQSCMLEAHFLAPSHRLTSTELRASLGLPIRDGGVLTGGFVSFPDKESHHDRWVFELRQPVVQALNELSPLGSTVTVHETTLKDLAVVCGNCHRMIHRSGLCRSLEQVGAALLAQPNQRLQRMH